MVQSENATISWFRPHSPMATKTSSAPRANTMKMALTLIMGKLSRIRKSSVRNECSSKRNERTPVHKYTHKGNLRMK